MDYATASVWQRCSPLSDYFGHLFSHLALVGFRYPASVARLRLRSDLQIAPVIVSVTFNSGYVTDLEKPVGRVLSVFDVISESRDRQRVADEAEQTERGDQRDVDHQLERLERVDIGGRLVRGGGRRTRHERVEPGEVVRRVDVVVENRRERRVHPTNIHLSSLIHRVDQ